MPDTITPLRNFVHDFTALIDERPDEARVLDEGSGLLQGLLARDDWLPDAFAQPNPERYQQYLLHCDALERFSVVSFVWGPGQTTPVHDHTVWGLIGILRGAESCEEYSDDVRAVGEHRLDVGEIDRVSPTIGDVHRVSNVFDDRVSLSIHVYGANIGAVRRHVFDPESRRPSDFISGYSSDVVPNLWDRSMPA